MFRHSLISGCLALLMAALPLVLILATVARYEPSDDWEVMADQADGWNTVGLYGVLSAVAGLSLLCAVLRWPPKRDESLKAGP